MPVQISAVSSPHDPSAELVRSFFERQLSLTSPVAFVPEEFKFSGDSSRLQGEEAEKKVFDAVRQGGRDIPGIQIICFHAKRLISKTAQYKIREVDFCLFIAYQGRHYILLLEVKCNDNPNRSRATSKKAHTQLKTFEAMLGSELNVPTDKLHFHAVWPNMPETVPCSRCRGSHPPLYELPVTCQQPGTQSRAQPEPAGFHLFKDTFENGGFTRWIKEIAEDHLMAVELSTYDSVLDFVARHCMGVLYDHNMKSFCIMGRDQEILVRSPEIPLDNPTIVYGLAGTGKTTTIMSRIQHISGNLNQSRKALFICPEDNVITMVEQKLRACRVDLSFVHFVNRDTFREKFSHPLSDISEEVVKNELMGKGYHYIYFDSAEDLGIDWVNSLLEKISTSAESPPGHIPMVSLDNGDFWVTIDPYQGLDDGHCLVKGFNNQVLWQGTPVRRDLLEKVSSMGRSSN